MASKFRGIAIIPCLRKLYFATLADAMGYDEIDLGEHQFAFRQGYRAAEVLFILRQLGEKGQEFQENFHILDEDIYKAHDSVEHAEWAEAMRKRETGGWHPGKTERISKKQTEVHSPGP